MRRDDFRRYGEFHTEYSYQNKIKRKKFNKKKERGEFTTQLILYSNSCKEIILGDIKLGGGSLILNIPAKILLDVGNCY